MPSGGIPVLGKGWCQRKGGAGKGWCPPTCMAYRDVCTVLNVSERAANLDATTKEQNMDEMNTTALPELNVGDLVRVKTWDRTIKTWGEPIIWVVDQPRYAHEWQGPMFVGRPIEGPQEGHSMCEQISHIIAVLPPLGFCNVCGTPDVALPHDTNACTDELTRQQGLDHDDMCPNCEQDISDDENHTCESDMDLVYARCLVCHWWSEDPTELEMWNGYGDHDGPTWSPTCSNRSVWVRRDGSVAIATDAGEVTEVDAPEDCCSGCGEIKKASHMRSYYRHGIDPCGVMYCRACDTLPTTSKES